MEAVLAGGVEEKGPPPRRSHVRGCRSRNKPEEILLLLRKKGLLG